MSLSQVLHDLMQRWDEMNPEVHRMYRRAAENEYAHTLRRIEAVGYLIVKEEA